MTYSQSAYHSKIFSEFKKIEPEAYRSLIRYYQEYEEDIKRLDFSEHYELLIAYLEALFEIGSYEKFISIVDPAIELTILNNIKFYKGEDIYKKLLFRKAAAHFNNMEFLQAEHVIRELIKMNPGDDISIRFLKKCLRRRRPRYLTNTRAFSIFLFFLTASIIAIEILIVRTFFKEFTFLVEATRTVIFFSGCGLLLGGYLIYRWQVNNRVDAFVEKSKKEKKKARRVVLSEEEY